MHVVEFPRASGAFGDEFVFTLASGAVAFVFPEDDAIGDGFVLECGVEADAFHWVDLAVFELGGIFGFGEVNACGHEIDKVCGLVVEFVFGFDAFGPVSDEGSCNAALVDPVFVFAERGIGCVCPAFAVGDVGICRAGHDAWAGDDGVAVTCLFGDHVKLKCAGGHGFEGRCFWALGVFAAWCSAEAFGAATVVLKEEDKGIVETFGLFEGFDDGSDALVHGVDHGGVDFHASDFPIAVFNFGPVASLYGHFPFGVNETEFFHFGETSFAYGGVSGIVGTFVFGDVFGQGVHGPVGGGVADVEKKGFLRCFGVVFVDVFCGMVGDGGGVVVGFGFVERVCVGGYGGVVADQ